MARSPFFTAYLFLAALSYARWLPVPGQTDVFPVCGRPRLLQSFSVCHLFCLHLVEQGQSDVFPDRVQVHGLFHFCVFLPLLCFARMRIASSSSLFRFLNFQVVWSGVRLLSFAWFPLFSSAGVDKLAGCLRVSKSSDSRRFEDWLSLISRFPLNSVLTLCSACLEG